MFPLPDVATLRLCSMLASCAYGVVYLAFWLRRRDHPSLLHWGASALLYAAALVLFQSAGHVPGTITTAMLTTLIAATDLMLLSGVRVFDGRRPFQAWMGWLLAATFVSLVGSGLLPAELAFPARYVGSLVLLSICMAATAIGILRSRMRDEGHARWIAAGALFAYLPGYLLTIISALRGTELAMPVALVPMLADQLLFGILNMAFLAMPLERALRELKEASLRDPLTNAANRNALKLRDAELARANPIVLLIDLDHFKQINDRHGHAAGDTVLIQFASAAQTFADDHAGTFARVGGDEFVVILPAIPGEEARAIAEQFRQRATASSGQPWPFTISIGLSRVQATETGLSQAFSRADRSLYQAKARGRDQVAAA